MENRRQYYRHCFTPERRLRVVLNVPGRPLKLTGDLVDLSVGGLRVRLESANHALQLGGLVITQLISSASSPIDFQLAMVSEIVHSATNEGPVYGLHFLPSANPVTNQNRDTTIWRFLMDEQRRAMQNGNGQARGRAS